MIKHNSLALIIMVERSHSAASGLRIQLRSSRSQSPPAKACLPLTILYHTMLCFVTLFYAMLRYATLCSAIRCYATQSPPAKACPTPDGAATPGRCREGEEELVIFAVVIVMC